MRLVYTSTGVEVKTGDEVQMKDGSTAFVGKITKPHKSSSSGKIVVYEFSTLTGPCHEYYVGVIGAEWIDREDRANEQDSDNQKMSIEMFGEPSDLVGQEKFNEADYHKYLTVARAMAAGVIPCGGFARKLAEAFLHADMANAKIIIDGFAPLFKRYSAWF